ncbi:fasciclin domain-containing protein [Algoriphagus marincola]|uniref:fasciclin domain-containing protein n=1 Tax=Algoriphagus marincola TaxID=264027 RepID=UPI0003F812F1|nr:fasciclin domain-containing protein [Algoriphagus marincola]
MKINKITAFAATFLALGLWTACSAPKQESSEEETMVEEVVEETPVESNTVVDIAIGSPDHTTLVAAVQAAGLVETLSGDGPFTVFAPTNAAFEALPAGTVEGLLEPESKEALTGILTYHVVSGNVMSGDLSDGQEVTTLNGQTLTVSIQDGKVMIGGATVVAADLAGSNGVIHVIDTVLLPE